MNYKDYHRLRERLPQLDQLQIMMDTRSFNDFLSLLIEAANIKLSRLQEIAEVVEGAKAEKPEDNSFRGQEKILQRQMQELTGFKQALEDRMTVMKEEKRDG